MCPETLPLSLKVATLAADNAGFSSILTPALGYSHWHKHGCC